MSGFIYTQKNNKSISWEVEFETSDDRHYRNYVILKQHSPDIKSKGRIPFIMMNPGSFDNEQTFGKDATLRNIRNVFLNTGFEIEILNLFNICEVDLNKLSKSSDSERNKNNPIERRLNECNIWDKVIIQWGKLDKDFKKKRSDEILDIIDNKGLIPHGLKSSDGIYYHPRYWPRVNGFNRFKEEIIPKL